jgi:hypothetical protein
MVDGEAIRLSHNLYANVVVGAGCVETDDDILAFLTDAGLEGVGAGGSGIRLPQAQGGQGKQGCRSSPLQDGTAKLGSRRAAIGHGILWKLTSRNPPILVQTRLKLKWTPR